MTRQFLKNFTEKLLYAMLFYCSKRLLKLKRPIIARSASVRYLINPHLPSGPVLINWISPFPILGLSGVRFSFLFYFE